MTIGVSKLTENYESWLRSGDADMTIINLYDEPDVAAAIARCDGILFSGGNDVNPKLYGHEEYLPLCYGVDEHRDEIERELISRAEANTLPMLAICRGLQMFNVVKGGTLFADIYAQNNITTIHTKNKEIFTDAAHPVDIEPGTLLHKITKTLHGTINSSHHQAVAELARNCESPPAPPTARSKHSNGKNHRENHSFLPCNGTPNGWNAPTPPRRFRARCSSISSLRCNLILL